MERRSVNLLLKNRGDDLYVAGLKNHHGKNLVF